MKAPKCRSCGKAHWGICEVAVNGVRVAWEKADMLEETCPHCGKGLTEPVAKGFDKKAYQREYMRRKRAKGD